MSKADRDLVRAIEERGFNSWPALRTALVDGWIVRLSDGHTRRANSASPLWPSRLPPKALIAAIEPLFRQAVLRPVFRITPLADPAVERHLVAAGWRDDDPSLGMFAGDPLGAADPAVIFESQASEAWIAAAMEAYGHGEPGAAALRRLLPLIAVPAVFATLIEAGEPLHDMRIRLTLDIHFLVHEIEVSTDAAPFNICAGITPNFSVVKGLRIGPGWKRALKEKLGGVHGCTHHVEMLGAMATVAYQTLWSKGGRDQDEKKEAESTRRPAILDSCHALASDSPVVKKIWPKFYTGKEEKRA